MSLGSGAGVYAHWHLGQAHQTSFKVGACGCSACPGWVLWHRGTARAQCVLLLVSGTPQVNLKSWSKLPGRSKCHYLAAVLRGRKGRAEFSTGKLPWASWCCRAAVVHWCECRGCSRRAGLFVFLNLLLRRKMSAVIILILIVRWDIWVCNGDIPSPPGHVPV